MIKAFFTHCHWWFSANQNNAISIAFADWIYSIRAKILANFGLLPPYFHTIETPKVSKFRCK